MLRGEVLPMPWSPLNSFLNLAMERMQSKYSSERTCHPRGTSDRLLQPCFDDLSRIWLTESNTPQPIEGSASNERHGHGYRCLHAN